MVSENIRNSMHPAPQMAIEGWLAEMSVIVAKRVDDEFSEELRVEAYSGRLGAYPADVARSVAIGMTWKFWPTWSEMEKECERLTAPRRNMLAALSQQEERQFYDGEREEQKTGEARRIEAINIMKQYGFRVQGETE